MTGVSVPNPASASQLVQAQGGDSANMFGVSISLGSQKSSSQQHQEQTSVIGSTLTAGNNLTINATGDGNPANSGDIVVQGSQLKAGGDTTLDAARDVLLLGAANTQKTDGSNSSSGGSVGVSVGIGGSSAGLSIFANANKGQGKEHGDGTTLTETQIDTGGTLSLSSGRDTSLVGAQASGETVKVDVGRDLLLQSQQDSDNYDSKQTSTSGGISVAVIGGGGSANLSMSQDKLHSNYDSVQEQTGIFAGKGGFDITVGEHTQLDGAVIASTADKSKNSLDTGTLGFSNIENTADFKAEHQGGSLSTGGPVGSDLLSNLGSVVLSGLGNSGHAEGTTQAAIADGTLTIRDTDKQQQNVDDLSRDTDNANGSIGPIFDKEKEQNRLKEAQLIGEIGGQAMDIARTQGDILGLETALKANPALKGDAEALRETKEYKAEMKKYGTGSALQQGIQAATAAIQGLAGGDMAKALAGASAPYLAEVIHNMTLDPTRKGGVNTEANLMAHAVLGAVVAQVNGNSALAGASGAVMGEYIAQQMYPGIAREDLDEEQRQTISALGTLAAGLAGGLVGGSTADTVAGAQAGKNAVENNALLLLVAPPPPVAGQAPQSEANTVIAQKLDDAVKAFGREVVKQCLSGGDCPLSVQVALLAIQAMMGQGENGPSDTGGDQIVGSGLTNTGGDQTPGNSLNHTGGDNTTGQGITDTGNQDSKPDTGGNSTVTPIPGGLSQDDIAYISKIWSDKKNTTSVENAYGHWQKHGAEFPEYKNAKQYVEAAHNFVTNPPDGTLTKTRPNGDTVYYNPSSNTFGIKMSDGSPRTMFKPDAGMDYWNKQ